MGRAAALASFVAATAALPAVASPTLIVDARTGEVVSSEEATRPWYPASTVKMMTAYVALKAVRDGRIGWETVLPVSRLAAAQKPSKLGLRPGSEITLENAMRVMLVKSANDLAVVVAEGVGGSMPNFVNMMNSEARRLGMHESYFTTANGLHQPGQKTSARDLAILARALYNEFPEHRDLWSTGAVQVGRRIMKNTNGLIGRYPGAEGMKTGFVCASGFNLVGLASRGGRTLIAVVLGAGSGAERSIKTAQLLDQGFASWSSTGQTLESLPPSGYDSAPDVRNEICRGGRGVLLADDVDSDGPLTISEAQRSSDSFNPLMEGIRGAGPQGRAVGSVASRTASGRITLGPRADFIPVQIALGPTSGSATAPLAANAGGSKPTTAIARAKPEKPATAIAARGKPAAPVEAPAEATAYATSAPAAPVAASAGGGIAALFGAISPTPPSAPLSLQQEEPQTPGGAAAIRPKTKPQVAAVEPEPKKKVQARKPEGKKVAAKPKAATPAAEKPEAKSE